MGIEQVVNVTVTRQTLFPSRAGFGILLLMAAHSRTANLTDLFTSVKGMEDAGFVAKDPAHRMATVAFSQNPKPKQVVVGKRTHKPTMAVKITPVNVDSTTPFTYSFTVVDKDLVETPIEYEVQPADTPGLIVDQLALLLADVEGVTSDGSTADTAGVMTGTANVTTSGLYGGSATLDTLTLILTVNGTNHTLLLDKTTNVLNQAALLAAIHVLWGDLTATVGGSGGNKLVLTNAIAGSAQTIVVGAGTANTLLGLTAAASSAGTDGAVLIMTADAAGQYFDLKDLPNGQDMKVEDITPDPGIATDLAAVFVRDPSTWYELQLDESSKAQVTAAAAWTEAQNKLFGYTTADSVCSDNAVATDVFSTLKLSAYARTFGIYVGNRIRSYANVGWSSKMLALTGQKPGSGNWAYITIAGVEVDTLRTLSDGQKTNIEAKNGNTYSIMGGLNVTMFGKVASGEYVDLIHGSDWVQARTQERVFGQQYNASNSGTKIPYTDKGIGVLTGLVLAQLDDGITNGFVASDPAPTCTAPKRADIEAAERANRNVPDIVANAVLQGAVNTMAITINLSV